MSNGILVRAIAIVVSIVFVVGSWITSGSPDSAFVRYFSIAVFISSIAYLIWDRWLWKLPLSQLIPGVPRDASGTWSTLLESLWVDPSTGATVDPKTVYVVIRQTSSQATLSLLSDESSSRSSIARVVKEGDAWLVHYVYTNEPRVDLRGRSAIHHGSGVLTAVGSPVKRLAGSYWTDRESKGALNLTDRSSRFAEDFDEAKELFVQD